MNPRRLHDRRLTVEHLRSFLVVSEELSFKRAAERLYVAPSPLSRRIKEVEAVVGATLFARDTRNVRLTPAGEKLVPLARDVVARFDALARAVRGAPQAEVRVGMPYGVHWPDRAAFLAAVGRAAGARGVETEPGMTRSLAARLAAGELHASVVHDTVDLGRLETLLVREEAFGVMLPAAHPLGAAPVVALGDLRGMRFVTVDFHPLTALQVRMCQLVEAAGAAAPPIVVDDLPAMTAVVASSASCFALTAASPGSPYLSFFADPDVAIRPLEAFPLTFRTLAAWLPERAAADPLTAALVQELERTFAGPRGSAPSRRAAPAT